MYINWHDIVATYIIILVTRNLYIALKPKRTQNPKIQFKLSKATHEHELKILWSMVFMRNILYDTYMNTFMNTYIIYTLTYSHIQKLNCIWQDFTGKAGFWYSQ